MEFYKILWDDSDENDIVVKVDDKYNALSELLNSGNDICDWDNNIILNYSLDDGTVLTDFLANDMGWYIVSEKVRKIIVDLNLYKEIQLLPIILRNNDNNHMVNYWILNIKIIIDAFDLKNSDYKRIKMGSDYVYIIRKYCLIKDKVKGYNCIKVFQNKTPTFFSELLVKKFLENSVSGIEFRKVVLT